MLCVCMPRYKDKTEVKMNTCIYASTDSHIEILHEGIACRSLYYR